MAVQHQSDTIFMSGRRRGPCGPFLPRARKRRFGAAAVATVVLSGVPAAGMAGDFPVQIELSALDGSDGVTFNGVDPGDWAGGSTTGAGDVNGDGIDDLVIGARYTPANGKFEAGQSYVVFGTDQVDGAVRELSALDGTNGVAFNGIEPRDLSGYRVAGAGDVNGDGLSDVIIGAHGANPGGRPDAGQSYVVFGRKQGFPGTLELSALDGTNGFALNGINDGDHSGLSVAGAGDVNGDGIDDIIVGARLADPGGRVDAGQSYVVFGTDQGFPAEIELSALDGTNGFALNGINPDDYSGYRVAGTGDVNGDGIDDIVVGARGADPDGRTDAGQSYVVFGADQGFPAVIELSALDGGNGFVVNGSAADDWAGSVAGAGDINGDGLADVAIGAHMADPNGKLDAGQSYIVFGTNLGFPAVLELSALDGVSGFTLNGGKAGDWSGRSVRSAGDVNRDGIGDLVVGSRHADPDGRVDAGQSYVVFGTTQGFPTTFELSNVDGTNGFALNGINENDWAGRSVAGAGDFNGDGVDDIVIGAPGAAVADIGEVGQSYAVYGRPVLELTVSGNCPGHIDIGITGASPNGSVALGSAPARGSYTIGTGACAGTTLNLATPRLQATLTADPDGLVSVPATTSSEQCGKFLQVLDWNTCLVSNLARVQ